MTAGRASGSGAGPDRGPTSVLPSAPAHLPEPPVAVEPDPRDTARTGPKLSFFADPELQDLLARARDLVSHSNPNGDLATLLRLALRVLVTKTERRRFGQRAAEPSRSNLSSVVAPIAAPKVGEGDPRPAVRPSAPRWRSRYIPIAVRRAVWQRDGGRCAYAACDGHHCATRAFLQFHHLIPFAQGGEHTVENLALRCGPHNRYEADCGSAGAGAPDDRDVKPRLGAPDPDPADFQGPEPTPSSCLAPGFEADRTPPGGRSRDTETGSGERLRSEAPATSPPENRGAGADAPRGRYRSRCHNAAGIGTRFPSAPIQLSRRYPQARRSQRRTINFDETTPCELATRAK